jgi:two-component system, cell cycle response regulator
VEKPEQLRLLVIEDDPDQRDLIRETLEDHFGRGTVVTVETRAEAMAQDLASFDLILSDYNLPDASGLNLLDEIKGRCSTPVIMVTGENVGHTAVAAIQRGATDYVVKLGDYLFTIPLIVEKNLTVAKVKREKEALQEQLEEKNAELQRALLRVEEMAATDALTGLYNRRHFSLVIEQMFAEAQRYDADLSCVMIDMDGFKQINDTLGHQVGDQLLTLAGKCISANMRRMDVAARYGGDEFVILLPRANVADAELVAQRISIEFKQAIVQLLKKDSVSMSIGIGSHMQNRPSSAHQLVRCADSALYNAKQGGRNRIIRAGIIPPAVLGAVQIPV